MRQSFRNFQVIDSVMIYHIPEKLTLVIHLKEALDMFSEMSLAESYVVSSCGIRILCLLEQNIRPCYLDPWALVNHHHLPLLHFRSHASLRNVIIFPYHFVILMSHVYMSYPPNSASPRVITMISYS